MNVHLGDHITFRRILKFTIFPIIMMVFTSLYSIVDGIFISNFSNPSSFAAVNLVMPFIMIVGSVGFMMGAGGSALVSKYLGQREEEKANNTFSLIIYATVIMGLVISVAGFFLMKPIVEALASLSSDTSEEMVSEAILYGRILILAQVFFMLQNVFQSFFLVAERSKIGFIVIICSGVTNIILDALFVGILRLGVVGAAMATICGYLIASISSIVFFRFNKKIHIRLGKAKFDFRAITKSVYNGVSEFVTNMSMSIVSIIYNIQLLRLYGENGVAAYGIIMYVSFVFVAIFIGYSMGVAPVIGYNFGAENHDELKNILRKSLLIIFITGLLMALFGLLTANPFSRIFANNNAELLELSSKAMKIYSIHFFLCGFSIFLSAFFTALSNGTMSALISLLRTLVFQISFVLLFPAIFGSIGIWWAAVGSDALATIVSFTCLIVNNKKYKYL